MKAFTLDLAPDAAGAFSVLERARCSLLSGPAALAETPLAACLDELEACYTTHLAILQPAAGAPNATALIVVNTLVSALSAIRRGHPAGSAPATATSASGIALSNAPAISNDALEQVFISPVHQKLARDLKACDLSTEGGRRDALTLGFNMNNITSVRLLSFGDLALARRDPTCSLLSSLRPYLSEYTNYCLRVDTETEKIPDNLVDWSITGPDNNQDSFFLNFWAGKYDTMDWMGSATEPGMLSFRAARDAVAFKPIPPADHYCNPMIMRQLGEFGQTMFVIQGWPDIAVGAATNQGFTWNTWCIFYAEHLEKAFNLPTRVAQQDWIDYAHDQFIAALKLMRMLVSGLLNTTVDIAGKCLNYLMPWDAAPAENLRKQWTSWVDYKEQDARYTRYQSGRKKLPESDALRLQVLPLRSERHRSGKQVKRTADGNGKSRGGDADGESDFHSTEKEEVLVEKVATRGGAQINNKASKAGSTPHQLSKSLGIFDEPKQLFYASGVIFDVKALCKHYHTTFTGKCWHVLLTKRSTQKLLCCPCPSAKGHEGLTSAAHVLKDFKLEDATAQFGRSATPEEFIKINKMFPKPERGPNGAIAKKPALNKGGDHGKQKGKGPGRGGQSFQKPART